MKTLMICCGSALLALAAYAPSSFAQAGGTDGCLATGGQAASPSVPCVGGPLKAGDPRLGLGPSLQAAGREQPRSNSFKVGSSDVTISGSVRVEGVFGK